MKFQNDLEHGGRLPRSAIKLISPCSSQIAPICTSSARLTHGTSTRPPRSGQPDAARAPKKRQHGGADGHRLAGRRGLFRPPASPMRSAGRYQTDAAKAGAPDQQGRPGLTIAVNRLALRCLRHWAVARRTCLLRNPAGIGRLPATGRSARENGQGHEDAGDAELSCRAKRQHQQHDHARRPTCAAMEKAEDCGRDSCWSLMMPIATAKAVPWPRKPAMQKRSNSRHYRRIVSGSSDSRLTTITTDRRWRRSAASRQFTLTGSRTVAERWRPARRQRFPPTPMMARPADGLRPEHVLARACDEHRGRPGCRRCRCSSVQLRPAMVVGLSVVHAGNGPLRGKNGWPCCPADRRGSRRRGCRVHYMPDLPAGCEIARGAQCSSGPMASAIRRIESAGSSYSRRPISVTPGIPERPAGARPACPHR